MNVRFDSLYDIAGRDANLLVVCNCGNRQVISARSMLRLFHLRNWNNQLVNVRLRLRCRVCLGRPDRVGPTAEAPTMTAGPDSEYGWKMLARRLRG